MVVYLNVCKPISLIEAAFLMPNMLGIVHR